MAVTHFEREGNAVCNTRVQKNPLLVTEDETKVTCKKCLKMLNKESEEAESEVIVSEEAALEVAEAEEDELEDVALEVAEVEVDEEDIVE